MSTKTKNKNTDNQTSRLEQITAGLGLAAMSMAAVATLVELDHSPMSKAAFGLQAAYAHAVEAPNHGEDPKRRGMEETRHTHASYGVTMRSHPTAGSL
ncbi:MAG: hypothetical protein JWP13_190 [Candidatus Saccharibacteria bacterium]|nr:hypothetical protein [Candidatus Saccharibacteria bacterium]